jgi:hypothetical protein
MNRRMIAVAFVVALLCIAPVSVMDQALASHAAATASAPPLLSPLIPPARSCTQHVCYICAQAGMACTSIPYCHCI